MLNLGLGVELSGKDMGLSAVLKTATESLTTFGHGLTTGWEAKLNDLTVTGKQLGANMGKTGADLHKFTQQATGMAIGLNMGAEESGRALRAFTDERATLTAMGLKSADDVAKMSKVFGVSSDDLRDNARTMRSALGLSADQVADFTKTMTAAGSEVGDVGGMLKTMPAVLDKMRQAASEQGTVLDPAKLVDIGKQVASLTTGFFKMGYPLDKAQSLAEGMSQSMIDAQKDLRKLMAGTQGDLSQTILSIGVFKGDIGAAFQDMQKGPAEFAKNLVEMTKGATLTGEQFGFLKSYVEKAFDPATADAMMLAIQKGDASVFDLSKTVNTAKGDLGKLTKEGFSTGYTLADSMHIAQDSFLKTFRDVGRPAAQKFVHDTTAEFRKFGAEIKHFASQGGDLGAIITKFSEISSIGASALVPQALRPMAAVFAEMSDKLGPLIDQVLHFAPAVLALTNPFLAAAAAAAGLFTWFQFARKGAKSDKDALDTMFGSITKGLGSVKNVTDTAVHFVNSFIKALTDFPWADAFSRMTVVAKSLDTILSNAFSSINWAGLFTGLRGAGQFVFDILTKIPWDTYAKDLFKQIKDVWNGIPWDLLFKSLNKAGDFLWDAVSSVNWEYYAHKLMRLMGKGWDKLQIFLGPFVENAETFLGNWFGTEFPKLLKEYVPKMMDAFGDALAASESIIGSSFDKLFASIEESLTKKFPILSTLLSGGKGAIEGTMTGGVFGSLTGLVNGVSSGAQNAYQLLHPAQDATSSTADKGDNLSAAIHSPDWYDDMADAQEEQQKVLQSGFDSVVAALKEKGYNGDNASPPEVPRTRGKAGQRANLGLGHGNSTSATLTGPK